MRLIVFGVFLYLVATIIRGIAHSQELARLDAEATTAKREATVAKHEATVAKHEAVTAKQEAASRKNDVGVLYDKLVAAREEKQNLLKGQEKIAVEVRKLREKAGAK